MSYVTNFAQQVLLTPILDEQCGSAPLQPLLNLGNSQNTATYRVTPPASTQYVLNVRIHYINNNVLPTEQEDKALDMVASLNLAFNQANIFFKFIGYDNIPDPSYLTITVANVETLYPADTENIEIYIPDVVLSQGTFGWCPAWRSTLNNQITRSMIAIRKDRIPVVSSINQSNLSQSEYTLVHEVGHYLGLYHTHQLWKLDSITGIYTAVSDNACRIEENLDNSQWNYLGDLIQDTNPDRTSKYWSTSNGTPVVLPYNPNCTVNTAGYHNDTACNTSVDLLLFNPPMSNIMSYYRACRSNFSANQYTFMRNFIDLQNSSDSGTNGLLMNKLNTIENLYLPFAGGYPSGIYNPNIPNPEVPRFQKGFDYKFIGCDFQLPKVKQIYTVNQTPTGHPYYQAIKIMQIDPNINRNCNIPPESAFTGGQIISFDNPLYNGNITIQNLNNREVTDPNLKNNLPIGQHILKTNLNDGQTFDENIIKQ